jgi:nucleotidyltransferase substrate binding protein (TIGR01987 family)
MSSKEDIRWKQRFEHFTKALFLLRKAFAQPEKLSDLEKEGAIQRFEYTVELAWKTLKDYLESSALVLDQKTPKNVIKHAFAANLIQDGQLWIDMLETRNRMSHTYDEATIDVAIPQIGTRYLPALEELYEFFKQRNSDA